MRKQSTALTIPLLVLAIFGFIGTINAQTVTANSCSETDVQNAVNAAPSGYTVTVPACSATTWSNSVTISNAIHLQGAGIGSTIINYAGSGSSEGPSAIAYTPTAGEATKTFELNGFTFQGGGEYFNPNAPSGTPITGLKIHNNAFNGAGHHAIHLNGLEFGVFYSNTFSGNYISVWGGGLGWTGESYPHAFGSANYPYFEDNTFGNGAGEFVTETGQGGRLAFRHNTISGYACGGCEVFDLHGDQGSGTTISEEIYHNSIDVGSSGTYRWVHHRGGQAIIFNNTISRNIEFNISEYRSYGNSSVQAPANSCTNYPVILNSSYNSCSPNNESTCIETQVHNSFYFNNVAGGTGQTFENGNIGYTNPNGGSCGSDPPWGDNSFIQLNREFWEPTYGLASALPATCTANGNTYYGTTDTDMIYKCTATNTWTAFYQPYTYPHPLRSGSTTSGPAAPTNLSAAVQ